MLCHFQKFSLGDKLHTVVRGGEVVGVRMFSRNDNTLPGLRFAVENHGLCSLMSFDQIYQILLIHSN